MRTRNIPLFFFEDQIHFHKSSSFAFLPGVMIKSHWLELPISRTNFHGPKDVRAIEVRLYLSRMLLRRTMSEDYVTS